MLEVIDVVKRVSGNDFEARLLRRPGDPLRSWPRRTASAEPAGAPALMTSTILLPEALAWKRALARGRNDLRGVGAEFC